MNAEKFMMPDGEALNSPENDRAITLNSNSYVGNEPYHVHMLYALRHSRARFPISRKFETTVRGPAPEVLDEVALSAGLVPQRTAAEMLLLHGADAMVMIEAKPTALGSTLTIEIWAMSLLRLEAIRELLLSMGGEHVPRRDMFTLDWRFHDGRSLASVKFDELAEPPLLQEAYPAPGESVEAILESFLSAQEAVLVLLGPPGTGKTRLVRSILSAMSRRKGDSAQVLYTADLNALAGDEIFSKFIVGNYDAFVVEDADHLMKSRSGGNCDMHRFLAIADGVVRAQGRKIIFTSNLPNISDIDEALIRPGRAFAVLQTRLHTIAEATQLLRRLCPEGMDEEAMDVRLAEYPRGISLAQIYQLLKS